MKITKDNWNKTSDKDKMIILNGSTLEYWIREYNYQTGSNRLIKIDFK
jgi:hypothetical protein